MSRCFKMSVSWLLFGLASCTQEESSAATTTTETTTPAKPRCGVYLAPSTIPGSGLGMFAGDNHYKVDDTVTLGDAVIPLFEYEWNNVGGPFEGQSFLWDEYTWNGPVFPGMEQECDDADTVVGASPGVGAAANSYLSLVNVEDDWIKLGRGVDAQSPGVGANTPYHGREFFASEEIPPGGEIFVSYGAEYFKHRANTYGYLPLPETYPGTDVLLKKYLAIKDKIHTKQNIVLEFWSDYYEIILRTKSVWGQSRVLNGLPDKEEQISHIMENGGSSQQHYNRSFRDVSWLEENGQCMDNIKVGNSTNPDAGRGAFANRFIPKGGLVAPAPLIHVKDYNAFKMFQPKYANDDSDKFVPNREGPVTWQLLLNYCFGHEKSTLLLCPYGLLIAFINHSHENPNTRIQWSQRMRHPEWRNQPISEWWEQYHTGLQIDFVALRDIEEGEEIFIDYGSAWESAWQEHVKTFVPREGYVPAFELNEILDKEFRSPDEDDYEANGLFLLCRGWYIEQLVGHEEDYHCRILQKMGDDRYVVQVLEIDYMDDIRRTAIKEVGIVWNLPSAAFFFEDIPYTRDHFQPNAFRHAMMIPDDMFPEVWKNLPNADMR